MSLCGGRKVALHEREVTAFHVGALWQRPLQSVFDDCGSGLPGALFFWFENILCVGPGAADLCVLPDVFPGYEQAECGEPMVSAQGDESPQLDWQQEKGICTA